MYFEDKFQIESLIYIPTGRCVPVYNRPYVVNTTQQAIDKIAEKMVETKQSKVTTNILNNVSGDILQHNPVGYISAVNDNWTTTAKFIFLLKVRTVQATGASIISYIYGYTNYDGITQQGHIDRDLVHYVNNIIETADVSFNTMQGYVHKEKLHKLYNVFYNGNNNGEIYTQRPIDIINTIEMQSMASVMDGYSNINYINAQGTLSPFTNTTLASAVDNSIPTNYLTRILNTGLNTNKEREIFVDSYSMNSSSSPEARAPEPMMADNRFMKYLSRKAGFNVVREFFSFGTLMDLDSTIYQRFQVVNLTKDIVNVNTAATPDVGDYWHGQDPVTLKAYSLIESSVALAMKYGFNKLTFIASNLTNPLGTCDVFITNFSSVMKLDQIDHNHLLDIFKEKFVTDIFLSESAVNTVPIHAEFFIDLLGTTKINLTYAGFPSNWYTIPTYANSLFSSVMTIDKTAVDYSAIQLNNVIETIAQKSSPIPQLVTQSYY